MTKPEASLAEFASASPEDTLRIGEIIGKRLRPGNILALTGGLGAGKTCFSKGIAKALGVEEEITSPTYTIINEYQGRLTFYHIDAYRLSGDEDFAALGAEELLYGEGISLIEWSERIPNSIPPEALTVEFEIQEGNKRRIRITGLDEQEAGD
ncbi:tRNA (adenosine(37)-N6)-threonylcarbamoyltransferase complex ATPase subunit type 1 TsaE [Treponema sp. OttesenSCG-928-L16]|nr:tRNA (adenosine(37)-N6)-threonylcarbamoyltransferase complex ATPase subunit type 1 TsaE [Treponema sp. OttesenSCG-928-L16]